MISLVRFRGFFGRNSDSLLAVGIAAGAVFFFSGYFTPVRFDRERIDVRVAPGQIHVRGRYHYTNTSRLPAVLTLKVPFPVDSEHPQPEWYGLYDSSEEGREGAEIVPTVRGDDVSFRLIFWPREEKWVRLDYLQPTRVSGGRYLLTTTKPWRRPIAKAEYVLRLPSDLTLLSSNYAVSPAPADGTWQVFTFSKFDFFPERDWEFAWNDSHMDAAMRQGDLP
ncbi:MAG: hypothetical protein HY508_09590 [Acidobacteria bacterium]|nr:hypothetical protein [Acidobacteriota bacterium]